MALIARVGAGAGAAFGEGFDTANENPKVNARKNLRNFPEIGGNA